MATIASRITNTGTLLVNGSFDEVTFNSSVTPVNKFYYSQDFSNSLWIKSGSVTLTSNNNLAPDGSSTAYLITVGGAGLYPYIATYPGPTNPVFTINAGETWTVSSYVKYGTYQYCNITNEVGWTGNMTATFDLVNGTVLAKAANVAAATISSVGNGWYRISATYGPAPSTYVWNPQPIRLGKFDGTNYSGNTMYVWGAQLEKNTVVSTYQPISANTLITPTFATKTVPDTVYATGQFDEVTFNTTTPTIKNINTYTQQFTDSSWTKARSSTSASTATLAPDGSSTVYKLISDVSASTTHYCYQSSKSVTAGLPYTFSIYAKAGEYTGAYLQFYNTNGAYTTTSAYFNLLTGAVTTSSGAVVGVGISDAGNGWYRIWLSSTALITVTGANVTFQLATDGSNGSTTFTGDGVSGTYFWGAQYEQASAPTIYQGIAAANTLVTPNFAKRETKTGDIYVTNIFDEVTGAP